MEYAVVDIETTGGNAASGGSITEIAIRIFDGNMVIDSFESLVKPNQRIPPYITLLTGIDDVTVQDSPSFDVIAPQVYAMLESRIFVAHNVHFDYSFIKQHLENAGYRYQATKLCTIQLARIVRPGLPSYGLGNICASLGIEVGSRHRAGGDADATVALFHKLVNWDVTGIVPIMLEKGWGVPQVVPDGLRDDFEALPNRPGVYYFYNDEGEVIYIGKANDLKKRVAQHFKQNNATRRRRNFTGEVSAISYEACGTSLHASLDCIMIWSGIKAPEYKNICASV